MNDEQTPAPEIEMPPEREREFRNALLFAQDSLVKLRNTLSDVAMRQVVIEPAAGLAIGKQIEVALGVVEQTLKPLMNKHERGAAVMLPKCQYCSEDPCIPIVVPFRNGDVKAKTMFCPNPQCRAIFNIQIIQIEQRKSPGGLTLPSGMTDA